MSTAQVRLCDYVDRLSSTQLGADGNAVPCRELAGRTCAVCDKDMCARHAPLLGLATNTLTSTQALCIDCQDAWIRSLETETRDALAEEIFAPLVEAIKATIVESQLASSRGRGQADCTHGITFDEEEAERLALDAGEVRSRWPRLNGNCPLGCGYTGIYYVSTAHFVMGDW